MTERNTRRVFIGSILAGAAALAFPGASTAQDDAEPGVAVTEVQLGSALENGVVTEPQTSFSQSDGPHLRRRPRHQCNSRRDEHPGRARARGRPGAHRSSAHDPPRARGTAPSLVLRPDMAPVSTAWSCATAAGETLETTNLTITE